MDKGFRKRVAAFIIISLVTAGVVWIYMHYNQHSRSRLTMLVPANAEWFYHFQTRQIEEKRIPGEIPYFDSLKSLVPELAALKPATDRGEYGLDGHSDIVIFKNPQGWFVCLAMNNEGRMLEYLKNKVPAKFLTRPYDHGTFYLCKATNRNLYFAFRHKACMFFVPTDTAENGAATIAALKPVFDPQSKSLMGDSVLNKLYDSGNDVVFWSAGDSKIPTHGVKLEKEKAVFTWIGLKNAATEPSPLQFFRAAGLNLQEKDVALFLDKQNQIAAPAYLNLTFKTIFQYLKPFQS